MNPTDDPFVLLGAVPLRSDRGLVRSVDGAKSTMRTDAADERDVPDIEPDLIAGATSSDRTGSPERDVPDLDSALLHGTSQITKAGTERDVPDVDGGQLE